MRKDGEERGGTMRGGEAVRERVRTEKSAGCTMRKDGEERGGTMRSGEAARESGNNANRGGAQNSCGGAAKLCDMRRKRVFYVGFGVSGKNFLKSNCKLLLKTAHFYFRGAIIETLRHGAAKF